MIHLQPGRPLGGGREGTSQGEGVVRVSHLARSWHYVVKSVIDTSVMIKDIVQAFESQKTLVQIIEHLKPRGSEPGGPVP